MIGPDAETIAQDILTMCDDVEDDVRKTVADAPAVIDRLLDAVRVGWPVAVPLPDWAKDQIRALIIQAVEEAAQVIYDALEVFRSLARSVGRPSVLRQAAARLDTDVVSASSSLDTDMTSDALRGLDRDSWDSPAADSYQKAFTEQARAVGAVDEVGDALRTVLEDLASSIEEFFDELQLAVVSFAATVAGLVVAIATIELVIPAIISLVAAIASALLGVYSLVSAFTGSADHNSDAVDRLESSDALDWPESAFAQ